MLGTPDEVKVKSGTPCNRNLENTQPAFVLQLQKYSTVKKI
jgi:hypothetical protein